MKFLRNTVIFIVLILSHLTAQTEDSVYVTFFYHPDGNPTNVYLPGEFNGWTLNNSSRMTKDPASGIWSKTELLRVGGPNPLPNPTGGVQGAYQYKIHVDGNWMQDPLNPRQNPFDHDNSYLYINNPTVHYLLPNTVSGVVRTRVPEISAYIFPSIADTVNTASIKILIDGNEYNNLGSYYDPADNYFSFQLPDALSDGSHSLELQVESSSGSVSGDATSFTIQANSAQLFTRPAETLKEQWPIYGTFFKPGGSPDSSITLAELVNNDSVWTVTVTNGVLDTVIALTEGDNNIFIRANNEPSLSIIIKRIVNHHPYAKIAITENTGMVHVSALNSTHPDSLDLSYQWLEDPANPELLGINGSTDAEISVSKPSMAGEYYIELAVSDTAGRADTTRSFFVFHPDSAEIDPAGYADNPGWVKNSRIYLLFFKGFTPEGTIQAAIPNLEYIKAMGFNTIWLLPIFEIPGNVDNQINIGYYIEDFFKVEQSLGTGQDFHDFMNAAHALDLKVILDITPNHTGNVHEYAIEAAAYGDWSPYWNYYQTTYIPHNTNGLGDCVTPEGIYYYCAFSSALLNYNWDDIDAREYFLDILRYWVSEYDVDGYRFDVYWGPQRRYGEEKFGVPIRNALKHIKPDILLLGETEGTGSGSEIVYADQNGGLDAAYDWSLKGTIHSFNFLSTSVNNLHNALDNNGYYPGENSYYLRFLENQDEDRISYIYDSYVRTKPVASAVFLAPGIPQLHYGQEVGFGKDMGNPGEPDLNDRRRGIIDWNFDGKDILQLHYQKLTQIRAQFPAFSQHRRDTNNDGQVNSSDESEFIRVSTGNGLVYSYLRPWTGENGLMVTNFSNSQQSVTLNLLSAGLKFDGGLVTTNSYWINDLYTDTSYQVLGSDLANFQVSLDAWGTAVYAVSTTERHVDLPVIPTIVSIEENGPVTANDFELYQNYPNPFNPGTTFRYRLPSRSTVKLEIFNIAGEKIATILNANQNSGYHEMQWDGRNDQGDLISSGVYIYRLSTGKQMQSRKMILMK